MLGAHHRFHVPGEDVIAISCVADMKGRTRVREVPHRKSPVGREIPLWRRAADYAQVRKLTSGRVGTPVLYTAVLFLPNDRKGTRPDDA